MMESQRSQQVISQTIKNLRANNPENFVNPQQFLAKRLFDQTCHMHRAHDEIARSLMEACAGFT